MSKAVRTLSIVLLIAMLVPLTYSHVTAGGADCANTIYVDASRPNDAGPGTSWATAYKYIQSGVDAACLGGTVYVAAGVYDQPATTPDEMEVVYLNKSLTLIGAGALTTFIDGKDSYRGISIASEPGQVNTVRGFTIRNGEAQEIPVRRLSTFIGQAAGVGISFPDASPGLFNGSRNMPDGGGIFITDQHVVTIEDCAIIDNYGQNGGGIYNSGQLTMNRCTVANNRSYDEGGGIYMRYEGSTLDLTNCTISGNRAEVGYGGGIRCGTDMSLINCTITGNSVTDPLGKGGGFALFSADTAYFLNCIVANNTVPATGANNGYSNSGDGVISEGYNIDSENTCYFDEPTDQINTNPLLGSLRNNGGPTSTCAITVDSPAYNRGTNMDAPTTDQRGITRPQAGAFDIGAFELVPATATTPPRTNARLRDLLENESGTQSGSPGAQGAYGYSPPVALPTIVVQSASLSANTVTPGAPITVTADMINKSAVNGNKKVTLYVNGQVDTTQSVTVNSGGSAKLTFNVSRSEPGDYLVYVDGVPAGSFKVELFSTSDIILTLSAALVAIALIIGMVMLGRRQRTG